jgi:hypothetical protein
MAEKDDEKSLKAGSSRPEDDSADTQGRIPLVVRDAAGSKKTRKPLMTPATELTLLTGAFALTAVSLAFSKRVHALAGGACLGLVGYHLYRRKKRIPFG